MSPANLYLKVLNMNHSGVEQILTNIIERTTRGFDSDVRHRKLIGTLMEAALSTTIRFRTSLSLRLASGGLSESAFFSTRNRV
jgi:hypothetical protein